jgi:hypothetical protein
MTSWQVPHNMSGLRKQLACSTPNNIVRIDGNTHVGHGAEDLQQRAPEYQKLILKSYTSFLAVASRATAGLINCHKRWSQVPNCPREHEAVLNVERARTGIGNPTLWNTKHCRIEYMRTIQNSSCNARGSHRTCPGNSHNAQLVLRTGDDK